MMVLKLYKIKPYLFCNLRNVVSGCKAHQKYSLGFLLAECFQKFRDVEPFRKAKDFSLATNDDGFHVFSNSQHLLGAEGAASTVVLH